MDLDEGVRLRKFITYPNLYRALDSVQTPNGIQASNDYLFRGAEFPRDEMEVCFQLLPWLPSLVRRSIFSILSRQGRQVNSITEEEPGRIFHELRQLYVGGERVGAEQEEILRELGRKWGGSEEELCYYGAVDTTPNIVRLVGKYAAQEGDGILDSVVRHNSGKTVPLADALLAAVNWVMRRTAESDIGLLEFHRSNPQGHRWQVMRDGHTSYMHEDGSLANAERPIASLDVQGLAFDCLIYATELLPDHPDRDAWLDRAQRVRRTTLDMFWLDEGYFAMAIDRDQDERPRQVKTETTMGAELLETRFFDDLSVEEQKLYVGNMTRRIFSEQFLTPVGLRSWALRYTDLMPYAGYQSSLVSWGIMTDKAARGYRAAQMAPLGALLEDRMVDGFEKSERFWELWYVDRDGRVAYHASRRDRRAAFRVTGTNVPENLQAWSVGAALRAILSQDPTTTSQPSDPIGWKLELCEEVLAQLRASESAEVDTELAQRLEIETYGKY
jgi:glycogen debranching enzyme